MNRVGLFARLVLGPLRAGRGRMALAVGAIALGVALGYAVQLVNRSAINEFSMAVQALSGAADLQIRGPRAGFAEELYARVAQMPEVAVASPVVEVEARVGDGTNTLRLLGIDVFRAGLLQPGLIATEVKDSLDLLRPDTIFLSPSAARALQAKSGDTLSIQVALGMTAWRVAGLTAEDGARVGVVDIAAAQTALQRLGRIDRLDLRLRPGVDIQAFRARLQLQLPPGLVIEQPQQGMQRAASLSRSYRVNLNVLALVALFTGGLLVFSTQALAVVRRRAQLGLLRVLGVRRNGVLHLLLGEALALGVVGSSLGLLVGYGLAQAILDVVGPDLGSGYFRGLHSSVEISVGWAAVFFSLGVAATLAGSFFPALEAAHAPPAATLKAGDEQKIFRRLQPVWPGVGVLALAGALLFAPAMNGLPLFGYVSIALLLVGTLMLMPRWVLTVLSALPSPKIPSWRLAWLQLRGAPGQSMLSLTTIVASVSLLVAMAIMVSSFRGSLDAWLDHVLPADLYVRAGGGDSAFLAAEDQQLIASIAGVRRVDFTRIQNMLLAPDKAAVSLLARDLSAHDPGRELALVSEAVTLKEDDPPPAWVSEAIVDLYGYVPGNVIELPIAGRRESFKVAGVWRDYVRTQGAVVVQREEYQRLTADRNANDAALWLNPGVAVHDMVSAIRDTVPGADKLDISEPGEIKQLSLRMFDRTFAVTYVLELVALLIGLTGLSSSLGSLVLARRREFGMLRHLGMTRRQIGGMLAAEGLTVSALGLIVGLVLGWAISLVLIHVVNRQSFHWSMDIDIPWTPLIVFCGVMLVAASLTAFLSARLAMTAAAVRVVKDDW